MSKKSKGIVGVRLTEHRSAKGLVDYFLGRYYLSGQELGGKFGGKLAEEMGIAGEEVSRKPFFSILNNRHPRSGKKLSRISQKHICAYEASFHTPKDLSILYSLGGDERILGSLQRSVQKAMTFAEQFAATRVRKDEADSERPTQKMVWAEFVHITTRPVKGIPDPDLHVHCPILNVTWDPIEKTYKALKTRELRDQLPLIQAVYLSELANEMRGLGYTVERRGKGWAIRGIPESLKEKFSRRTQQIEEIAQKEGVTSAVKKARIGARSREGKSKLDSTELQSNWNARGDWRELDALLDTIHSATCGLRPENDRGEPEKVLASDALDFAVEKSFERISVVGKSNLLAEAMMYAPGQVELEELMPLIGGERFQSERRGHREWITTADVLQEENESIGYVRRSKEKNRRFSSLPYQPQDPVLSDEQQSAAKEILKSRDGVVALLGPAGSGKTTLIREVDLHLRAAGHDVLYFAPTGKAVEILQEDGFAASTVQSLLQSDARQSALRGKTLWVDEAGLLSFKQMRSLFAVAEEQNCRVILSGDPAQHTSVERGDALRVLLSQAGLTGPSIRTIRRQRSSELRAGIEALSDPSRSPERVHNGFRKLSELGCIREEPEPNRRAEQIAEDYLDSLKQGRSVLVVSPTHAEGRQVTAAIRDRLGSAGTLSEKVHLLSTETDLSWETAEKRRAENYEIGMRVRFNRHGPKNLRAGVSYPVVEVNEKGVLLRKPNDLTAWLPLHQPDRFQVHEVSAIPLQAGDRIQLTGAFQGYGGRRLANKSVHEVENISEDGQITLRNGVTLDRSFRQFKHGYVTTSHSSQGATVDRVIIAQSSASRGASSSEQFYVSASRARHEVHIYTDNVENLREMVLNSCHRPSAVELLAERNLHVARPNSNGYRKFRCFADSLNAVGQKKALDANKQNENAPPTYLESGPRMSYNRLTPYNAGEDKQPIPIQKAYELDR